MPAKHIELKVGILVLVSLGIITLAVYLGRGFVLGQEYNSYRVYFDEVGALSTGARVTVSGVPKGKVTELELDQGKVLVTLDIESDVTLKEDATFSVKNVGLMGERFVAVTTGTSDTVLSTDQPAVGEFDAGIPEVMGLMGQVVEDVSRLVTALEKSVMSPQTLDKFSESITSLKAVAIRLDSLTHRSVPKIDQAIADISSVATTIESGIERNQAFIDSGAYRFSVASQRLDDIMVQLEATAASVHEFALQMEESEGTMRLLMEDRRLYDDLRRAAQNLDSLVLDIRAHPQKYINLSVEIF